MTDQQNQNAPTLNAPNDDPLKRAGYKDLSLVSLVPKWSGRDSAPPIQEFFDTIDGSAAIGNWTQADMKQVCALKLTDAARALYSATPELRNPNTTWQDFKSRFLQKFPRRMVYTIPFLPAVHGAPKENGNRAGISR